MGELVEEDFKRVSLTFILGTYSSFSRMANSVDATLAKFAYYLVVFRDLLPPSLHISI